MKKIFIAAIAVMLSGCGYTQRDGEVVGQGKKVTLITPLICPGYVAFDLSLGVMRNGSGSMSTQDIWFTVQNGVDIAALKRAVETGQIVKVHYDTRRVAICTEDHILNSLEITQ